MKKAFAICLVLCMVFAFAACGDGAAGGGGGTSGDNSVVGGGDASFADASVGSDINIEDLPRYKIAFTYATFDDKLGGQFKQSIQYLCDAFNCEAVFFVNGSGDEQIANWESVLAAGDIDGVITVGVSPAVMEVAKKYSVPVVAACGFPSVDTEISGVAGYDNFLGGVIDDDYWAGTRCIEALYEAGCRNITYSGLTVGFVKSHDDRMNAMKEVVAAHDDLNLLADSYSMGLWADDIATFNASFPEMDGMGFSAITDAVYLALETEGLTDGRVKIAGVDISSQTGIYFKNGVQVWTCGGQYATAMVGWAVLYNYLADGTRIIENTAEPIVRKYLEITSYEEYEHYVQYVESPIPTYNADEIAQMIHIFNEDITFQDYLDYAENYTLDDIVARRS